MRRIKGFTLLEMSVVLVVIGLLTGGILVGQTMIRESQINSAMTDAQRYISATSTFQQKYGSLPGDMANATSYWGSQVTAGLSCPPTAGATSLGGTSTCPGDGNGQVNSTALNTPTNSNEAFLFWQHLANAQLIQGNYTGIAGSAGNLDHVIGVNAPAGRLTGLGFGITYAGITAFGYNTINYGHVLQMGGYTSGSLPATPLFTIYEAQSFDSKFDDGAPSTGNVQTFPHIGCAVNSPPVYIYNGTGGSIPASFLTSNRQGLMCTLFLLTGF